MKQIIGGLLQSIIPCILLYVLYRKFKKLLPSYLNEKGKNLAMKEDVPELTQLAEKEKFIFTESTEQLKAKLQFLNVVQNDLTSIEREAIIDFNEKLFLLKNFVLDINFGYIDDANNEAIDEYIRKFEQNKNACLSSEANFKLFIGDPDLFHSVQVLRVMILLEWRMTNIYLTKVRAKNIELEFVAKNCPNNDELLKRIFDISNQKIAFYTEYCETISEQSIIIEQKLNEFHAKCRSYLYKLLNDHVVVKTEEKGRALQVV
ncbi:hypothetical protein A3860_39285 [Niastella vici]|uniref:Uncharacterized protein n=1 Tax=Niastella vici TaxID=1703345 RepID=A0A1V9FKI3_9BACT|nr:hypothetical protein [Niastella vici]OQP58855.1 hypothetical protein A3860_39285 [Niastella vici]